jgi:hypothetical protein
MEVKMIKITTHIFLLISSLLLLCGFLNNCADQKHKITGPITHKNLSIFLIHGKDTFATNDLITLQEAIAQKKIIIHETENVNELEVENISKSYIFIQEGDIVKGGKQDRVLQFDFVVNPKSGRMPISSFCVENGRWSKRGHEDLKQFNSSSNRVTSKKLRLAPKQDQSQQEVWEEVRVLQDKLSSNVGNNVNNPVSTSSLQLTLENKEIVKSTKEYIDNINKKANKDKNVIGYVFAINGEINSADIYANNVLFEKMWPKLLEACAIEAISELNDSTKTKEITVQQVIKWLDEVESGKVSKKSLNSNMEFKIKDSEKNILYETYIKSDNNQWIHKNMIKK